jgi:hypothetical protein
VHVDGRRVLIFDDRGWSWTVHRAGGGEAGGTLDPWGSTSLAEIESQARVVVGPDEPREGESQAHAAAAHWSYVADLLRARGVDATADTLRGLQHDVIVGDALRQRVGTGGAAP